MRWLSAVCSRLLNLPCLPALRRQLSGCLATGRHDDFVFWSDRDVLPIITQPRAMCPPDWWFDDLLPITSNSLVVEVVVVVVGGRWVVV
jgi:hypothetical protein